MPNISPVEWLIASFVFAFVRGLVTAAQNDTTPEGKRLAKLLHINKV